MDEIQTALIAIALVLSAVFLPMAFFGGSTGVIYRQFSLTIISAMVLSVLVALILSPALTANAAQARGRTASGPSSTRITAASPRSPTASEQAKAWFNRSFDAGVDALRRGGRARWSTASGASSAIYALIVVLLAVLFCAPAERLPADRGPGRGADPVPPARRRDPDAHGRGARRRSRTTSTRTRRRNVDILFTVAGGGGGGGPAGQNTGQGFVNLKHWDERPGAENTADAIAERATAALPRPARRAGLRARARRGARASASRTGFTHAAAEHRRHEPRGSSRPRATGCSTTASAEPALTAGAPERPARRARRSRSTSIRSGSAAYGLAQADVNTTLSTAWGGRYVNDFIDRGRVKRVYVQGDAPYRAEPEDLGAMVRALGRRRDGAVLRLRRTSAGRPRRRALGRFSGVPAFEISGPGGAGVSSGEAMDRDRSASPARFRAPASPGRARPTRSGCRRARRRCSTRCRCWSCSCASPRSTKAGRSRSRCCWWSRSAWSARSSSPTLRGLENDVYPADRPADDDGPRRQERDPDDRVRRAGGEEGRARDRRGAGRPRASACARS